MLIADDERLVREGIAALLVLQPGIDVVGTAESGTEAVESAAVLAPDVVLMDVRMPGMGGVEAAALLRGRATVLMLTTFDDDGYIVAALHAGASGYLLKDLPAAELAQAIRLAHAGVDQYSAAVSARLAAMVRSRTPRPTIDLTDRETEVLRLLATGAANREIARTLYLSEGTVKNHISSILNRLGVRDRTQAAIYAHEHGIL
ncbi:LuxR family two component transcriptional regulator [Nocardia fluminea]|uniref:LuxR family two component transcriptional regulator n=1 Tax=Nocardia fluminea TaxID=134984 RepID=A0A2N3VHZ7_9NOCA|nr:LuxR family two component transcriptional regulator [Nocardia fluminea]